MAQHNIILYKVYKNTINGEYIIPLAFRYSDYSYSGNSITNLFMWNDIRVVLTTSKNWQQINFDQLLEISNVEDRFAKHLFIKSLFKDFRDIT